MIPLYITIPLCTLTAAGIAFGAVGNDAARAELNVARDKALAERPT
jgi:hypothetical protein